MKTILPFTVLCLLAGCSGSAPQQPVQSTPVQPTPVQPTPVQPTPAPPVASAGRHHPTVDVEKWCKVFPIESFERKEGPRKFSTSTPDDPIDLWKARGPFVNGPRGVACVEQVRRRVLSHQDLGRRVPVDIFVWAQGDPEKPYLTKVGGIPHRERSAPWPKAKDGTPYTFVAQWCFLDSRDVVPAKLKDDVLLLFFKTEDDWGEDEGVCLEWSTKDLKEPARAEDCPKPGFAVPRMAGHRWRTFELPDSREAFEKEGHDDSWLFATTQSTKIGSVTWFIQNDPRKRGEKLLCTLNSFQVAEKWPYCNVEALPRKAGESYELMFGDVGCIYVLIDRNGNVRLTSDCY